MQDNRSSPTPSQDQLIRSSAEGISKQPQPSNVPPYLFIILVMILLQSKKLQRLTPHSIHVIKTWDCIITIIHNIANPANGHVLK